MLTEAERAENYAGMTARLMEGDNVEAIPVAP
jgi:hypothetical protein